MGQMMDRAADQLIASIGGAIDQCFGVDQVEEKEVAAPVATKKVSLEKKRILPQGVTEVFTHTYETSGNSMSLFRVECNGEVTYRVTTVFNDGDEKVIVRDDYTASQIARKLMGRRPKEESNG